MRTGVVIVGGGSPSPDIAAVVPADAFVVAADSGLDHAFALGLTVDLVVGDLDSVSPVALDRARREGIKIVEYPTSKDATDTELAIDAAVSAGCTRLVGVSGSGDRLDHLLGTVLAFASPRLSALQVTLWVDTTRIDVTDPTRPGRLDASPGTLFSVLPVHGAAVGVAIEGAEYPLRDAVLEPGTTRGISNVTAAIPTTWSVGEGRILVVVPDALEVSR